MGVSKVIYGGQTLIDLTADSVKADKLLSGYTAHGADGNKIVGTCPFDADTGDGTATESEILLNKTAYVRGEKITGKMGYVIVGDDIYDGSVTDPPPGKAITHRDDDIIIPQGYSDGSQHVFIDKTERLKLVPENIRENQTILGIKGTMSPKEGVKAQGSITVTPSVTQAQTIIPDSSQGYNYLTQVVVNKIPYVESANSAGGTTVTIG